MSRRKPKQNITQDPVPPMSRRKSWCFRLMALIGVPLLVLGMLELGLRLAGFGYPTAFLLNSSNHGENTYVQNCQFGWRFFGARAARQPCAISVPREKPAGTIRIIVLGESAAFGDPQPRMGLPRMLEAMLELRHPDKKFEVINAAMTGINSHVILPLARDCVKARADVWVIYMGNNEVVGPFGAGTVFGGQSSPLSLIRAGLALKATRTGQMFDALRGGVQSMEAGGGSWEGLAMFVKYKVPASDPILDAVYGHFEENLKDIIAAGRNGGAKIVLSTVAVNLKDCAPFASLHNPDLPASSLNEWQGLYDAGVKAQTNGDFRQAASCFEPAERIDGNFAELRFRHGQCALALGDAGAAQREFAAARDLDALRFRCDSRLNEIIRRQAGGDVTLADAERAMAGAGPDGIPGDELFYEHVHLTFRGNHLLARILAEKVEAELGLAAGSSWPDVTSCAQRLGFTRRDEQLALSEILGRFGDVPFTLQASHDEQSRRLGESVRRLPPVNSAVALREARSAAEAALARWPDDAVLWEQLGDIRQAQGDHAGAADAVQRALDRMPSSPGCWMLSGLLLAREGKYEDAATVFKHVYALDPLAVWARDNRASCLAMLGRRDEAVVEFKRALALKPNYGTAWLSLGQLYEEMGRTNDAGQCFGKALANRYNQVDDLAHLARFCAGRQWLDLALTNYAAALQLSPSDAGLRMETGQTLAALGRHEEALRQFLLAVELEPDQAQTHMQLGVAYGRLGKAASAEKEFRETIRLDPNYVEARSNLGIALYEQKRHDEALRVFETVLRQNPNDANARRYIQVLKGGGGPQGNQ